MRAPGAIRRGSLRGAAAESALPAQTRNDTVTSMVPGTSRENRETGAGPDPNSGAAPATVSGVRLEEPLSRRAWEGGA
jgi:hypothetical protein